MIKQNVPLSNFSNYRIGGPAHYFLEVSSQAELVDELSKWQEKKPLFVLGSGTNILISEKGFDGLIIHNNILGINADDTRVEVGAGVLMSDLLEFCVDNSFLGLEWAGGLPGSVGGAVRGNAGAFKGETKDSVYSVTSVNLKSLQTKVRNNSECEFGYRTSIFKTKAKDEIITSVIFNLKKGSREEIKKSIQEKIDYRNEKHPMDKPSLGSTFKNIPVDRVSQEIASNLKEYIKDDPFPVIPVAKLLFLCDLKGKREGAAQISQKHPNFIVNLGNARSPDVKKLIDFAKQSVKQKFGIDLEEEIMYLG